ncbi:MAG: Holliday junction resolvase RuvX [Gammaproteobacteria bacterium]|nr:Holliday junction resolvase RuvX [Gammaproteobacteria bacterium]
MSNITVLGFDFGMKHIGVAVGQTITRTANPLTSLKAINGIPKWDEIAKIITTWNARALVIGIPLNMDGTEQPITAAAKKFGNRLEAQFKLPVHRVDERLTTVEAKQQLFDLSGYKALDKTAIDSYSAKLILESWLQSQASRLEL